MRSGTAIVFAFNILFEFIIAAKVPFIGLMLISIAIIKRLFRLRYA